MKRSGLRVASIRLAGLAAVLLAFAFIPVRQAHATYYYKTLPLEVNWKEPAGSKYYNYCGPGATQVALDVRLAASQVPSIDTLGVEEKTNVGKTGTYMTDIVPVLNKRLSTSWYWIGYAYNADSLASYIKADIYNNYAMVTGLRTYNMPGWGTRNVPHIVAVVGYYESTDGLTKYALYTETASTGAGYNGSFYNWALMGNFWNYVSSNSIQAW